MPTGARSTSDDEARVPMRKGRPYPLRRLSSGRRKIRAQCPQRRLVSIVSPIIDIHTHCVARTRGDPFGVAETLRGIAAGKHAVTNYRGLPAVSYRQMSDTKT